jgi:hypothetical protein
MDPTPVTTVHAGPAERPGRRRAGVGRASVVAAAAATALVLVLMPSGALAGKPSEPPGQQKKDTSPPAPVITPAPTPKATPAPLVTLDPVITPAPVATPPPAPIDDPTVTPAGPAQPGETTPSATPVAGSGGGSSGAGGAADSTTPGGSTTPSIDPDADAADPADALSGGSTSDRGASGGGTGTPSGGSALPIALAGGAVVGVVGGLVLLAASRRRHEEQPVPDPGQADAEPPPDHEQVLADAIATHGGRRAHVGEAERLPLWVRRLDPEMPILPTLENTPGEMDDPGERRTGRFVTRPDAEPGETF